MSYVMGKLQGFIIMVLGGVCVARRKTRQDRSGFVGVWIGGWVCVIENCGLECLIFYVVRI